MYIDDLKKTEDVNALDKQSSKYINKVGCYIGEMFNGFTVKSFHDVNNSNYRFICRCVKCGTDRICSLCVLRSSHGYKCKICSDAYFHKHKIDFKGDFDVSGVGFIFVGAFNLGDDALRFYFAVAKGSFHLNARSDITVHLRTMSWVYNLFKKRGLTTSYQLISIKMDHDEHMSIHSSMMRGASEIASSLIKRSNKISMFKKVLRGRLRSIHPIVSAILNKVILIRYINKGNAELVFPVECKKYENIMYDSVDLWRDCYNLAFSADDSIKLVFVEDK